jgi:hypothetical protein
MTTKWTLVLHDGRRVELEPSAAGMLLVCGRAAPIHSEDNTIRLLRGFDEHDRIVMQAMRARV